MADDKDKKPSKPKPKGAPGPLKSGTGKPAAPPDGADPASATPALAGSDPSMAGGAPPPMFGGSPPMPGSGVDPYAALAGLISQGPPPPGGGPQPGMGGGGMPMPMGAGPTGDVFPGGGGGMGAGLDGFSGGDPHEDQMTRALMGNMDPAGGGGMGGEGLDPGMMGQQGMSLQQILTMLSLMQAGIPASGAPPTPPGRGVTSGIFPNDAWMTGA